MNIALIIISPDDSEINPHHWVTDKKYQTEEINKKPDEPLTAGYSTDTARWCMVSFE